MDRFLRILPLRRVVPLVAIVLAGLPWLLWRPEPAPAEGKHRAGLAVVPSTPVACRMPGGAASQPRLLPARPEARPLNMPVGNEPVLAATYPSGPEQPGNSAPSSAAEAEGPMLVGPAGPADEPKPSERVEAASPEGDLLAPAKLVREQPGPQPTPAARDFPQPIVPPQGSLLLSSTSLPRSEQLESLAQQADRRTRHGFDLAGRRAFFAARAEFIAALRLVAQGLDTEHQTAMHSRALSDGLTAIREAQDFLPSGAKLEAELDLPTLIAAHRTPVLKGGADEVRPLAAMKCYFTFAQEQLAAAAGNEVSGSMALCALGKLHAALARQKNADIQAPEPKAMVFLQAALLVYPQNHLASNELGVLLAQCGNPAEARSMLEHSVAICRGSTNLGNLAIVCQQMGDERSAAQARQQAGLAGQTETARRRAAQTSADGAVQWVDSRALAQSGGPPADLPPQRSAPIAASAPNQPTPAGAPASPAQSATAAKKPLLSWLPWTQEKR